MQNCSAFHQPDHTFSHKNILSKNSTSTANVQSVILCSHRTCIGCLENKPLVEVNLSQSQITPLGPLTLGEFNEACVSSVESIHKAQRVNSTVSAAEFHFGTVCCICGTKGACIQGTLWVRPSPPRSKCTLQDPECTKGIQGTNGR